MSSRPNQPPTFWQKVAVVAIGAAAIAFVVVVATGMLRDGVGTGNPLDPYRALGRILTDPTTWRVVALSGAAGGVLAAVVGLLLRRR